MQDELLRLGILCILPVYHLLGGQDTKSVRHDALYVAEGECER